jgi:hypothetical protein
LASSDLALAGKDHLAHQYSIYLGRVDARTLQYAPNGGSTEV